MKEIMTASEYQTVPLRPELKKIVDRLMPRVELEIHDIGYFRDFAENFVPNRKPNIYVKNIAVFIQKDTEREGRAYLGVAALHPTKPLVLNTYLMNGYRDKILEYMRNPNFVPELEKTVLEMAKCLKEKG